MRWRTVVTLFDYVEKNNCEKITVFAEDRQRNDYKVDVYPKSDSYLLESRSLKENYFPEIYIAVLPEVNVCGGTELILARDYVVINDLVDLKNDTTSEEMHYQILINKKLSKIRFLDQRGTDFFLPVAATFLNSCSQNYAHWMSEVLPKIVIFCKDARFLDIPIIVDENLHPNIIDSILMVVGDARRIYVLSRRLKLHVKHLHVVSSVGYVPFGIRDQSEVLKFHGTFSKLSLLALRRSLMNYSHSSDQDCIPRKIYLKRTGVRNLINISQINNLLSKEGFVEVDVNKLSLLQQISLFSKVDFIVAPTGASLANLIFCRPGTVAYVLIGKHQNMIYRYWSNMVSFLGVKVNLILGSTEDTREDIHGNFKINPDDLFNAIKNGNS
jgi:capsular polysaccharide biosynthesis protein